MKIFLGGRQTGKTTFLLRWLAATPEGLLICHNESEAARLRTLHPELGERIAGLDRAMNGWLRSRHNVTVAVDNLDLVLPYLLHAHIGPVTATDEIDPYWFD